MLDLRDILELVDNRLNNRTLTRQQLVRFEHQFVLHVAMGLGKELDSIGLKELLCQVFRHITLVAKHLPEAVS